MPATSHHSTWDARIARARELASTRPAASELLTFYAALAEYQRGLAIEYGHGADGGHGTTSTRRHGDTEGSALVERVVQAIPGFLSWLREIAPSGLKESVEHLSTLDRKELDRLVASAFRLRAERFGGLAEALAEAVRRKDAGGAELPPDRHQSEELGNPALLFVVESILQSLADQLVSRARSSPSLGSSLMRCPRCSGLPVVAVLREEGHGAKRFLLCALCLTEWECLRIVCPACGEQAFDALPVYTAEQFPHVRIDACDRCHHYLKTVDLTKDGLAVPVVDDIASVSLDLWARERGYMRIKMNVLGI